jgi:hypothetical protein
MPADAKTPDGFSLKRWSRRKLEAARTAESPLDPGPSAVPIATAVPDAPTGAAVTLPPAPVPAAPTALPPVESLTIDSDFTAFFQPKVDESLKRIALKKLFADPHFNVMDGLDVYIDDYSKSIPIPPEILEQLVSLRLIMNPPAAPGDRPPEAGAAEDTAREMPLEAAEPASEVAATEGAASAAPSAGAEPASSAEPAAPEVADDRVAGVAPETPGPR